MKNISLTIGGILLCAGLCLAARAADDAPPLKGTWSLSNWTSGDSLRLNLSYRNPTTRWEWGSDQPLLDLQGLTGEQLHSAHASVSFTLQRDAGTFAFEGTLLLGIGRGGYRFVPDPSYAAKLSALGYEPMGGDDISIMLMATRDISLAYASEVKLSGLRDVAVSDLVRFKDHGAGLDFIHELAATGHPNLTAADVIKLRDHGIDGPFVAALADSGYAKPSADEMIRLRDHGVDPGFIKELLRTRPSPSSVDDIIKLRDHGVDSEYVARIQSAGYGDLTVDQIIKLHDHGVD